MTFGRYYTVSTMTYSLYFTTRSISIGKTVP